MAGELMWCTSCALADTGSCPSYPNPVGNCLQYSPHKEAERWWDALGDKDLTTEVDGD